ncbi:MAG: hypothetical protein A4E40_01178 [Methanoregulaceae archaeon PtaU1.Bin059]|nr:MAG: hypothetical protein A4E40_01178 [Methanoregulaceae archaeon PtaU1.Bin059]
MNSEFHVRRGARILQAPSPGIMFQTPYTATSGVAGFRTMYRNSRYMRDKQRIIVTGTRRVCMFIKVLHVG